MHARTKLNITFALTILVTSALGKTAHADELKTAYPAQAGWALHLLETGRLGEAEDTAQSLIAAYPEAALPYELRGVTALYVGSTRTAQKDFARAAALSPDPAARYGLALCALFGGKLGPATSQLTKAAETPGLSAAQSGDIDTAQAYVTFLKGDAAEAELDLAKPGAAADAFRDEISALADCRLYPQTGREHLEKFLATPGGVPRLREDDGLRPLFSPSVPLEASVIEPDLQQMYADRLAGDVCETARHAGRVVACSGMATLTPTEAIPQRASLVSFSVDGQMTAVVSDAPYQFSWNTRHVANGTHTVRFDSVDAAGNDLTTQTLTVRVSNKSLSVVVAAAASPEESAMQTRLWNLLKLRPSRKVAEWTLAQVAQSAGDSVSADAHLANAAALDPAYKNGQQFARSLFAAPAAAYWMGSAARREVALTFDDGPNALKTPALLDALDKAHAPATFFVVGSRAELVPDILHRMATRGDEVENHSYTHPNMNLVIPSVAEEEILRTSVLIRALTGHSPHYFRPPGGNANPAVQRYAYSYGLSLAYWTVDALHAEDVGSSRDLVSYVMAHIHPGSIVLMHNGPDVTAASIPALVTALHAKGYTLVTLSKITQGIMSGKPKAMPKMKE